MKIWIDVRNLSKTKKNFCQDFINFFKSKNKENQLKIYADRLSEIDDINYSENFYGFLKEQTFFLKQLLSDKNDIVVSFDDTFPIFYKSKVIKIIPSLENILYPDLENTKFLKKYSYLFTIKKNLNNAWKIVCFSENTKRELNEKLNISEEKIFIINPFFSSSPEINSKIDIKVKLSILWDYLIYDYNSQNNNNLKRVLEAIKELNKTKTLNLVILWNENANNREIREMVINLDITKNIFFAWNPESKELWLYYKQSKWVIYPIIYDNFPITLNNAINYNTPIIASENIETKNVFWENIDYFSAISVTNMVKNIDLFLQKDFGEVNYDYVKKEYNLEKFYSNLISIID